MPWQIGHAAIVFSHGLDRYPQSLQIDSALSGWALVVALMAESRWDEATGVRVLHSVHCGAVVASLKCLTYIVVLLGAWLG